MSTAQRSGLPVTEYIDIPVRSPSTKRGKSVKYAYKIYNKSLLNSVGSQVPLILLPGWTGTMNDWGDLPHFISKSGPVITIDHRGIGFSEIIFNPDMTTHHKSPQAKNRPIPSFDYDDMVNDIYTLIKHLNITAKIDILGWSMGGMIAQHFCLTYPQIMTAVSSNRPA